MSELPSLPLVEEIFPAPDPEAAFLRFVHLPHCLFLDSARRDPLLGRYSFIAADPFDYLQLDAEAGLALPQLRERLAAFQAETVPGLPPFQGGAAGLFSYDLCSQLERLPAPRADEFQVPLMAIGLYDTVLAFDHVERRCWIISQGFPERDPAARHERATARLHAFRQWLYQPAPAPRAAHEPRLSSIAAEDLAPQVALPRRDGLTSTFDRAGYLTAIGRAIEYIRAGDIFQVNMAQRLLYPAHGSTVDLYLRLRQRNKATFAGYFDLGDFQLASASPERFVRVHNGQAEARPIKGTRRRTSLPEADLFAGDELQQSVKDLSENVMIVDLLRNDLSRICRPESVQVTQLCGLETYEFVQHLVSAVQGTLRARASALDLLEVAFPGGSITGAPKVRAMEIIRELEPTARGPYCGALGYLGFDGAMDSSILIRTITAGRGWWQMPVGGGIVAQSEPEQEYAETWHKAEGLLRSLQ